MDTWSEIAEHYHQFVDSEADKLRTELLYPTLWQAMEPLVNKRVLDIGCGNGFFAYHTASKGTNVEAFDNAAMISIAKLHFSHPGVKYTSADANQPFPYSAKSVDYVTANLVLMDMPDINNVLTEAGRVLKNTGKAFISVLHPCFTPPVGKFRRGLKGRINSKYAYFHLNNYFSPQSPSEKHSFGSHVPPTKYYHRAISEYANVFHQTGFTIANILEPKPNEQFLQKHPQFYHAQKISIFCIFILEPLNHRA